MSQTPLRVLVVDDEPDHRELIRDALQCSYDALEVVEAEHAEAALRHLQCAVFDAVILDYMLPGLSGLEALPRIREVGGDAAVLVITARGDENVAIAALKAGAADYVVKSVRLAERLPVVLDAALESVRLRTSARRAEERAAHLNSVLYAVRNVDQLITRERDPNRLLQVACELLTRTRGYRSAWAVLLDERGNAASAFESGYGQQFAEFVAALESRDFPHCVSGPLATPGKVISQALDGVCGTCSLSEAQPGSGVLSVSLTHAGRHFGVLLVSVSIAMTEDAEERSLFAEVAEDIAFALHALDADEDRRRHERDNVRLSGLYRALSSIGRKIIRIRGRQELFQEACRVAVQDGRFRMAWVGLVDPRTMRVMPAAFYGHEDGYLSAITISAADVPEGAGPTGRSLRQGRYQVCDDVSSDPTMLLWRAEAEKRGYRSSASFPFRAGDLIGVITLYSGDRFFFDDQRVALLEMLAEDIAIALERQQAEEDLAQTNRRLQEALEELRTTQQQVVQQERMRALGQMASGIAHDFNNALAPIVGFSQLLLDRPDIWEDTAKARGFLKRIAASAGDAASVVRRMAEFHRVRDDPQAFGPVNVAALLEQTADLTRPRWKDEALARGADIDVRIEADGDVPPVTGNASDLREALTNLVFNAADAMPDGGVITLRSCNAGGRVVIEVSDTGTGMTDAVRRQCLEPFFSTKGEAGTGLGLAMVHGIVKRHDGTLDIRSEVGQGTVFRITLPVHVSQPEAVEPMREAPPAMRKLRVLLVDDEARAGDVAAEYLMLDGHDVVRARDGSEGLQRISEGGFDLLITDRAMPGMSGDQLAVAAKQVAPEMPIVMLTGFGDLLNATDTGCTSVDCMLGKPVKPGGLRDTVARLTSGTPQI